MKQVRRITWSIFWKSAIAGGVAGYISGFAIGFVIGFLGYLFGVDPTILSRSIVVLSFLAGIAASFLCFNFFLAKAIGKQIGNSRLEIVTANAFGERT